MFQRIGYYAILVFFIIIDKTNEVGCDGTRHSNCHAKYSFSLNMLVLANYFLPNNSIGLLSFWKKIKLIFSILLGILSFEKNYFSCSIPRNKFSPDTMSSGNSNGSGSLNFIACILFDVGDKHLPNA